MMIEEKIKELILTKLPESDVHVENQSHLHKGHAGDDGSGQTHFHLRVVDVFFESKSRVQMHRFILDILNEIVPEIHALSMDIRSKCSTQK